MYWTQKHVLVCTASHCAQKGSNELIGRLRLEIVRKKLDAEILINNCGTIDLCDIGPNVVIYPDNVILSGVTAKDVPALVRYLRGEGDPPGEITGAKTPAELARRAFYRAMVTRGAFCALDQVDDIAAANGFDSQWIDEQVRRGFMARKPDPTTEAPSLVVTKKTLDRYRLRSDDGEAG
ncbi:MAG: (2Fe-2S) ferredoxin domain-containing protein [Thermomicrobiales bacterium]|nr:(2Fe-2S) ferredoxin domain-containing protein [Thermomicrobiales bacterium]